MSALTTLRLLQSQSLPSAVRDEITRLIMQGQYRPGDKLGEEELAEKLGVSRGPIREAFRGLEQAGLVRVAKNRGVFVRAFTADEARELYFVRSGIEEMIARILAPSIEDEQLNHLSEIIEVMEENFVSKNLDAYYAHDVLFHDSIAQMTGNSKLIEIHRALTNEMQLIRLQSLRAGGGLLVSNQEHRAMVEALKQHDTAQAMHAFGVHIMNAFNRVSPLLEEMQDSAAPAGKAPAAS